MPVQLVSLEEVAPEAVERLLDRAFGPGRHARTAYRIRDGMASLPALSLGVLDAGALIGTVQCWPVALHVDGGAAVQLVMVGPVAVEPARQGEGIGRRLTAAALDAAAARGEDAALTLIGDPEYYGRFFGFSAERTTRWRLPGPVEMRRLLARGPDVPDAAGTLGPRRAALAA
jgi:predicted N-acetyltransferase YhbS